MRSDRINRVDAGKTEGPLKGDEEGAFWGWVRQQRFLSLLLILLILLLILREGVGVGVGLGV